MPIEKGSSIVHGNTFQLRPMYSNIQRRCFLYVDGSSVKSGGPKPNLVVIDIPAQNCQISIVGWIDKILYTRGKNVSSKSFTILKSCFVYCTITITGGFNACEV